MVTQGRIIQSCGLLAMLIACARISGLGIASSMPAARQHPNPVNPALDRSHWKLTFSDEFNGTRLDRSKWIDSYPGNERTHSNNEQQYYAEDGWRIAGGNLRFKAERRANHGMRYTSGMVCSYGKFAQKFGWFEIRCRLPRGKGMWPAFWLLPADKSWPPEIDIMEELGHEPNRIYMTLHYPNEPPDHKGDGWPFTGPDFSANIHTFACDWDPGRIIWYVDGVERFRTVKNIPRVPMYILANLAVGGDWPGMPDASTAFPQTMDIDHIRVFARKQPRR